MTFSPVCDDALHISISALDLGRLKRLIAERGVILWYREGMVGIVPCAVIEAAVELYESYLAMAQWGRLASPITLAITHDQAIDWRPEAEVSTIGLKRLED